MRGRGLVPGLWLAPFVVEPHSRLAQAHPDWLLRGRPDRPVNSGYFYSFFGYALDATHPAVPEHLERLGRTLRGWGFGFIKADFCYAGALPARRHDPSLTRAQALRRGLEALRRGLGEETFLLGCGCPYGPALGIVDAMRIGPDTAPGWRPELWSLPWTRPLLRAERSLPSLRNALRHVLAHSCPAPPLVVERSGLPAGPRYRYAPERGGGAERLEPGGAERRPRGVQRRALAPVPGAPAAGSPCWRPA